MADDEDYQSQADGQTLMSAHEIRNNPKRHAAALRHLKGLANKASAAHAGSKQAFRNKIGKKMDQTFGKTPTESAEQGDGPSPEELAEKGE